MFGGLRRSEAEQLEWTEISNEFVEVKAHKAKTRQRRLIRISPQLRVVGLHPRHRRQTPVRELRGQAQARSGKGETARRMATERTSPFVRQLPFRKVPERK